MPTSLTRQFNVLRKEITSYMAQQPTDDQRLRNIARDVRFLSYNSGAPHPLTRWIFLSMLAPLFLIFAAGLLIEVTNIFKFTAPKRQPAPSADPLHTKGTAK